MSKLIDEKMTIYEALQNIESGKYVMPAFQRQYVWDIARIEKLWDSILLDYPISTFLFWHIDDNNTTWDTYFCQFLKKVTFDSRKNADENNYKLTGIDTSVTDIAILDGQQRLTSLYLSLMGECYIRPNYARKKTGTILYTKLLIELDYNKISVDEGEYNSKKFDIRFTDKVGKLSPTQFEIKSIMAPEFRDRTALLEVVLIIFKNKTAVLRVTLPLENVDSKPLISNDIDEYIDTAKAFYGYPIELQGININMLVDSYFRFLLSNKKIKEIRCYKCITNIIIANYADIFDDVNNIPLKIKEEIYKILIAPIQEIKGASYTKEAEKYLDDNAYYFKGGAYIMNSMGKCISIVDRLLVDYAKENFELEAYEQIINSLRISADFSIMIILLRLVNDSYTCQRMEAKNSNLIKVKNDYNRDKVFVSLLHSDVYGSARELTEAFENNMTFLRDQKNVEERRVSLSEIVEGEYRNRTEQLQNKLSIMGLIFTFIFGLPAINETLTLIRKAFCCIQGDIPYLTIDNCSFVLWVLITGALTLFVLLKSKIKKFE